MAGVAVGNERHGVGASQPENNAAQQQLQRLHPINKIAANATEIPRHGSEREVLEVVAGATSDNPPQHRVQQSLDPTRKRKLSAADRAKRSRERKKKEKAKEKAPASEAVVEQAEEDEECISVV